MIVIADSGSTKTDWIYVKSEDDCTYVRGRGCNPNFVSEEQMREDIFLQIDKNIDIGTVREVYFYGAGVSQLMKKPMEERLGRVFVNAVHIEAESDIIAAGKALLGDGRGLISILGTGANTCLYNGKNIEYKVEALGYVLGDEGSACYMGKRLIADYLRHNMPDFCRQELSEVIAMTRDELIHRIYSQAGANTFLASFSEFIHKHMGENTYYTDLVKANFRDFFNNVITKYPDYQSYKLSCVGSVAYYYKDILSSVAKDYGMCIAKVLKSPIEELLKYHIQKSKH